MTRTRARGGSVRSPYAQRDVGGNGDAGGGVGDHDSVGDLSLERLLLSNWMCGFTHSSVRFA